METDNSRTAQWRTLLDRLEVIIGKRPKDLNGILFLIGVQEVGMGHREYDRDQKMELFHIAICKLLSLRGVYEFTHRDDEGWPHYKLLDGVDSKTMSEQNQLLKDLMIEYFEKELNLA